MRASLVVVLAVAIGAAVYAARPSRTPIAVLVTGGTVITQDASRRVLAPGAVAVNGTDIVEVGTPEDLRRKYDAAQVIDATGQAVLPGLINTHGHAPMVMFRGLADDLALQDWLEHYIFPAEAKTVSPAFVRTATRLAAAEMIRSGTTTFTDMYYFEEEIARATRAAGLRAVLGQTVIQFPVADARTPAEGLARAEAFIRAFKGDPLITPAVAPHAMYTLDGPTLQAAAALGRRYDVPVLIHVAETRTEREDSLRLHGQSPVAYLDGLGFFTPRTVAAHGVWVSPEDIAILQARHVALSHNPESNMKLASGAAPVTGYLQGGVTVSLGTDGAASNNDLDMFEAMRQAAFLAKLSTGDPSAVSAQTALDMATRGGATALGLDAAVGSLEAGKRADLITVSLTAPRQQPRYDVVSHLVYVTRGDDVRTTIVNGRVLWRDGRLLSLDERAVNAEAEALAGAVREAVRPTAR